MITDASKYWEERYSSGGNSGYGSYDIQLDRKLKWLSGLNIKSISEIGCGDFNFGSKLMEMYPEASYFGTDVSETIIKRNSRLFPKATFKMADEEIPGADLILCIDVLFHILDENDLEKVLNTLEKKFTKYLAITAYERDEDMDTHVRIRKFDYHRFGEPIIREIVEENGSLYFYLFKKESFDIRKTSCCLITKEDKYPEDALKNILQYPFGEIMILTNCDSPHRKQELFTKAKYDWIYYQDDDCIAPIDKLIPEVGDGITCAMKPSHIRSYQNSRIALLGWGSFFPKWCINVLKKYTDVYGQDPIYKRETERIMTYLNYPQKRVELQVQDLPSAMAPDRLSMQPGHYDFIPIVEERCKELS